MLGGVSGAAEHEAEGDAAGAVPAPPAIDFPAESSDPKYDGEEHGVRRPSPSPSAFILGAGRWLRGSAQDLDNIISDPVSIVKRMYFSSLKVVVVWLLSHVQLLQPHGL